jgi:hypothetical protein
LLAAQTTEEANASIHCLCQQLDGSACEQLTRCITQSGVEDCMASETYRHIVRDMGALYGHAKLLASHEQHV